MQIASDLHFEFQKDQGAEVSNLLRERCPEAQGIILAGDLCPARILEQSLTKILNLYEIVVYLPGNHELYNSSWEEFYDIIDRMSFKYPYRFYFLNNNTVEIAGQRIVGSVLWFPQNRFTDTYSKQLNDFSVIEGFRPYNWNRYASDFLYQEIREGDIVVTHHAPSFQSTSVKYLGSPLNCFFVSDEEKTIKAKKPKIWIHGHMHNVARYKIQKTEVLCNPFGYQYREDTGFRWDQVIAW
jgi:predicted phosphohydrolase